MTQPVGNQNNKNINTNQMDDGLVEIPLDPIMKKSEDNTKQVTVANQVAKPEVSSSWWHRADKAINFIGIPVQACFYVRMMQELVENDGDLSVRICVGVLAAGACMGYHVKSLMPESWDRNRAGMMVFGMGVTALSMMLTRGILLGDMNDEEAMLTTMLFMGVAGYICKVVASSSKGFYASYDASNNANKLSNNEMTMHPMHPMSSYY